MCPEAGPIGEGLRAGGASESLNLVVHVHVANVVTSHGKPFPTYPTNMWHLLQVDTILVTFQPSGRGEDGITQITLQLLPLAEPLAIADA